MPRANISAAKHAHNRNRKNSVQQEKSAANFFPDIQIWPKSSRLLLFNSLGLCKKKNLCTSANLIVYSLQV
jgi:hypothetical protein